MQLSSLRDLHAQPPDASKDLLASIFWQEVHLEEQILGIVREGCADVLAPNAHMTSELTSIVHALASDKVYPSTLSQARRICCHRLDLYAKGHPLQYMSHISSIDAGYLAKCSNNVRLTRTSLLRVATNSCINKA